MSNVKYFCEYLPRLGKVNGCIEIEDLDTTIYPKLEGEIVKFKDFSVHLPSGSIDQFNQQVTWKSSINGGTFSLNAPQILEDPTTQDMYPWTAKDISNSKSDFKCHKCNSIIINHSDIKKVHPMPSELWSEMMEFWHCHKPNEGEEFLSQKISQRFNSFSPRDYNLLIGSYYIIINPKDWGLKDDLKCKCGEILGEMDTNLNNFKLFKWKLKWDLTCVVFNPCKFVTLKLLDEINSTGIRFYILKTETRKPILIWCFNNGININSNGVQYENCLKLFYKLGDDVNQFIKDQDLIGLHRYTTIEIEWVEVFDDFMNRLLGINSTLPTNQSQFNDWFIGYIN